VTWLSISLSLFLFWKRTWLIGLIVRQAALGRIDEFERLLVIGCVSDRNSSSSSGTD